jgi:NADH:ubiquinone oxidoreductase subunit F (NADH-binding)/NAD-dependent dihydropyrimidine dehydrogenase PreA subunit/(2Fe-2S) ferredoxin
MRLSSIKDLDKRRADAIAKAAKTKETILVCGGTGCLASGSGEVAEALREELKKAGVDMEVKLTVKMTGCHGFCERGPIVSFVPSGILYQRVAVKHVPEIVEKTVLGKETIKKLTYKDAKTKKNVEQYKEIPFYALQTRIALRNIGQLDPTSLDDYLVRDGFKGLAKALTMKPNEVIDEIDKAGLRGRGGGGFSTARKWRSAIKAAKSSGHKPYVICNGDEGDPGAFMDRSIMEGDAFDVLEGMIIAAWALGGSEGYIYVRQEYPLAVVNLRNAIKVCREQGLLGENILGSGLNFDIKISRGGGAFVCGESSALMASLAGKIGEPRAKYIHSVERGLHDMPTVLNNVETYVNVPIIIDKGGEWFGQYGTKKSKGTKAFALVGRVNNTGLIEVPMGITLRELIYGIGGGVQKDREFKAVQTGGPSGGCIPKDLLDLPVDFESLTAQGSMMGSGGMIVMDERTCMVDIARYFLNFLLEESCGKCVPCREGLLQLKALYDKITEGRGVDEDIDKIERLSKDMQEACLCALGTSAPNPVLSTLKFFRDEYEEHIRDKRCRAGVCKALSKLYIDAETCIACGKCISGCPTDAITGAKKTAHVIDKDKCIVCGSCAEVCPNDAVKVEPSEKLEGVRS